MDMRSTRAARSKKKAIKAGRKNIYVVSRRLYTQELKAGDKS